MADGDIAIDTRVTPSFQSANVRALPEYNSETAPLFTQVEDAFDIALSTMSSIYDAREKAANDLTLHENARMVMVADFADRVMDRATNAFDRANSSVTNNIRTIEAELSQPVQSLAANSSVSREIRDHVRGLKADGGSAMSFVTNCINTGDFASASAILGAPHYLSGLTPESQAVLLRIFHEKQNPHRAKQLAALKAAQNHLDRNSPLLFKELDKAVGDRRKIQMLRKGANASKKAFGL